MRKKIKQYKTSEYLSYKTMKLDNDIPLELYFDALEDSHMKRLIKAGLKFTEGAGKN